MELQTWKYQIKLVQQYTVQEQISIIKYMTIAMHKSSNAIRRTVNRQKLNLLTRVGS